MPSRPVQPSAVSPVGTQAYVCITILDGMCFNSVRHILATSTLILGDEYNTENLAIIPQSLSWHAIRFTGCHVNIQVEYRSVCQVKI